MTIYKEVFLQNKLSFTNNADDQYIYLKMPLQTLQTLPHSLDNQVIEEIYIDVDNSQNVGSINLILPPISNPNIPSLPSPFLPDYTSADTGFKGSWNIKIWITTLGGSGFVNVYPFAYNESYTDNINNAFVNVLSSLTPKSTVWYTPVEDTTWMAIQSAQLLL